MSARHRVYHAVSIRAAKSSERLVHVRYGLLLCSILCNHGTLTKTLGVLIGIGMKIWQCTVCGLIYEEEKGWPEDGIAPGTRWEDVPADWHCPECGVTKAEFEMVEF